MVVLRTRSDDGANHVMYVCVRQALGKIPKRRRNQTLADLLYFALPYTPIWQAHSAGHS